MLMPVNVYTLCRLLLPAPGKDLNSSMSLGPAENCDMVCPGNANQTCGGALALNVYEVMDKYWTVPGE